MRIGLIDVDGHNFPNLPLMKLSAWHKKQGDHVEWYQPLFSGHMDRVYMSKVFSFTPDYEYFVDADEVIKGGSGYCIEVKDGKEIFNKENDKPLPYDVEHISPDYSLYPQFQNRSYGYLTRGCPRNCQFCHTTQKDGFRSHKVADLNEFWNGQKEIILLDQNILACTEANSLLQQLVESGSWIEFNGGLDIRLMTEDKAEILKHIKTKMIHFAWDNYDDKDLILPKLKMFKDITGINRRKLTVYVLTNYNTTEEQDLERIYTLRDMDFEPYVMIYNKDQTKPGDPVRRMQRWCNNRYIFRSCDRFEDYTR